MDKEIETILSTYHNHTLWDMANAANLPITRQKKKPRKTALLTELREAFFVKDRVKASLTRLNTQEEAVLNRLLLHQGKIATRAFERELLRAGLATRPKAIEERKYRRSGVPYARGEYNGRPERTNSTIFADIMARLTRHGLVFSQNDVPSTGGSAYKMRFHPGSVLYIPNIVKQHLPKPEPIPMGSADFKPSQIEISIPELLLKDLYFYWDFIRQNKVELIQSGFVGKRWLKAINHLLLVSDPLLKDARREHRTGRLYFMRQLLQKLNLISEVQGVLVPAGKTSLDIPKFWEWDTYKQLSVALEALPQLDQNKMLGGESHPYYARYDQAQQATLTTLTTLPTSTWFEFEELWERLQGQNSNFLFPERNRIENYRGSWFYSSGTGSYYSGEPKTLLKHFDRLEIRFVEFYLSRFLHQFGIVDLGYEGDSCRAFRLTELGNALLTNQPPPPDDKEPGKLAVQDDFKLIVTGKVSLALLAKLDLFANREDVTQNKIEYLLSRESVYHSQQLGLAVPDIMHTLTKLGQINIPQNVRQSLEEWGTHQERIIFRSNMSLLQTANSDLLANLTSQPQINSLLARSLTPDVALIKKDEYQDLIKMLITQAYFPSVSGAHPKTADKSVVIESDGAIRLFHTVPSLHLHGRLSKIAEKDEEGNWRLTPTSIRQAGGNRNKVNKLLVELEKLHRGILPPEIIEMVKTQGNYYGYATTETITLIEFRDQAALEELCSHPDLEPYLKPFPAGNRALATVDNGHLDDVREVLNGFGVQVKEGL